MVCVMAWDRWTDQMKINMTRLARNDLSWVILSGSAGTYEWTEKCIYCFSSKNCHSKNYSVLKIHSTTLATSEKLPFYTKTILQQNLSKKDNHKKRFD